jgi:signal peptidase II
MTTHNTKTSFKEHICFFLVFLMIVSLDQWSKAWAILSLWHPQKIYSFFSLSLAWNKGVSFSLLKNLGPWPLIILSCTLIGFLMVMFRQSVHQRVVRWGLIFMISGAIGNVIDRVRFGAVIDFISLHYKRWFFPTFNVADMVITLGVILILMQTLREKS